MSPTDQATPQSPAPSGSEDDIIELTEVVDDAPTEVPEDATAEAVLDFRTGGDDMESLKSPVTPTKEPQEAPREESLDDFPTSPRTWTFLLRRPPLRCRQPRTCAKSWLSA